MIFDRNIRLETSKVLIRPLEKTDTEALLKIAIHQDIWTWFTVIISNRAELDAWIEQTFTDREQKFRYPFVIIDKTDDQPAGSTSYGNISSKDRRMEIGWTWLGKEFHHTGINKHVKFLMLNYAFEELMMERVEFKTDVLNLRSRRALQKIGATEEGILRSHTLMPGGRRRDSIYYSILKTEWPEIKQEIFGDMKEL